MSIASIVIDNLQKRFDNDPERVITFLYSNYKRLKE